MPPKRERIYLTIDEKYDIVRMYEIGMRPEEIFETHGITQSTLSTMVKRRRKIKKGFKAINKGLTNSWECATDLEIYLFHWYLQCKQDDVPMTNNDIRKKALEINEELNGNPDFKAGYTWLKTFKQRYRITDKDTIENHLDETKFAAAAEAFTTDFNRIRQEYGVDLKNVYNVVYRTIMWKATPKNYFLDTDPNLEEMGEDYVTALFCVNATGCHKLPVLIIGKIPESQSSLNVDTKPISTIYRYNTHACMDSTIFNRWYKENFLESVKERQRENECRERCLLLLDNANSLHNLPELNQIDPFVTVMNLPLGISPLGKPMNCGIMASFNRKFREELVKTLTPLTLWYTKEEVVDLYKELNIWDCCRIAHDAWSLVEHEIVIESWDRLWNPNVVWNKKYLRKYIIDVYNTTELLHKLPEFDLSINTKVLDWFTIDDHMM